jgi:hypothetical protein
MLQRENQAGYKLLKPTQYHKVTVNYVSYVVYAEATILFEGVTTLTFCVGELFSLDLLCILINKTGIIPRQRCACLTSVNTGIIETALTQRRSLFVADNRIM